MNFQSIENIIMKANEEHTNSKNNTDLNIMYIFIAFIIGFTILLIIGNYFIYKDSLYKEKNCVELLNESIQLATITEEHLNIIKQYCSK